MGTKENTEFFKEQLKLKNIELKKRDVEMAKALEKMKHLMAINEQKVVQFKKDLEFKAEAQRLEMMQSFSEKSGRDQKNEVEVIKEVVVQDPKLVQAVAELKAKNDALANQIKASAAEMEKVSSERGLLVKEVHRLRNSPDSAEKLKSKILVLEARFKELQARNEMLLREKASPIDGGVDLGFGETAEPVIFAEGAPEQLQQDFIKLKKENLELTKKLEEQAKRFETKLNKEIEKLKEELNQQSRKIRRGRRRENIAEEHTGGAAGVHAPFWMITFSDFSALLLSFFIVLYTLAAKNISTVKAAIMGDESAGIGMMELLDSIEMKARIKDLTGMKSKDILKDVTKTFQTKDLESQVSVSKDQAKIILRIQGNALFQPGKADLQKEARPILDGLINSTKDYPEYKINIQGHTDDVPIESPIFPTNWELSAARASAVLRYFLDKGIEPTRLTATGFADIFPLASNATEDGRAQNRRVELVLEKEK